jgi:hypothetical protein
MKPLSAQAGGVFNAKIGKDNVKIGKCGNVKMITTNECCLNFHISTFSNFHITKLNYICTLFIIILNKLKECGYLK